LEKSDLWRIWGQLSPGAAKLVANAQAKSAARKNKPSAGKAAKPEATIPIKEESIVIAIHIFQGLIVSEALQGSGLYVRAWLRGVWGDGG